MRINTIIKNILSVILAIIHIPVSLLAIIFKHIEEWNTFRFCIHVGIWISPIRLFSYTKRNIDTKKLIFHLLALQKDGIFVEITDLEKIYSEKLNIEKFSVLLICFRTSDKLEKYVENSFEYAYKILSSYQHDEDEILTFLPSRSNKIYLIDIVSDKYENLRMYVEFAYNRSFDTVMTNTLKGLSLQGTLKDDISKLLIQENGQELSLEYIFENKQELEVYLNQNINKEKYAFDIDTLSICFVNVNEVASFLNEILKEMENKHNFVFLASEISASNIETYLYTDKT